jgi:glutamate--cysteine ligase
LSRGGIEYVEIRSLDLNVFDPVGVNQNAMRFTEAFLIYCLLHDSPPLDEQALSEAASNHSQTAKLGRDPDFRLLRDGRETPLRDWAREIVEDVRAIAEIIDRGEGGDAYTQAVDAQMALVDDVEATPSARILNEMRQSGTGFYHFAMNCAKGHKDYFAQLAALEDERLRIYADEAETSILKQAQTEQSDEISFDEYLEQYYSDQGCC